VALPISDPGMDLRDIELQTLAGRSLPVAAQAFLELLKEQLPGEEPADNRSPARS